jgi:ABC-type phosphate transport system substrate-binding protein
MRLDEPQTRPSAGRASVVALLCLASAWPHAPAEAQNPSGYQVVVNAANPIAEIPRADLSRWFLGQARRWPDGRVVLAVDQSSRSEIRAAFCVGIHRQSRQAVETYWQKQMNAGRSIPPSVKVGDDQVMAYVAKNPTAIGYVAADTTLAPRVKSVKVKE